MISTGHDFVSDSDSYAQTIPLLTIARFGNPFISLLPSELDCELFGNRYQPTHP